MIIQKIGAGWLDKVLPPIVVGPVIMVIGLGLAANAANSAMFNEAGNYDFRYVFVALATLALTIFFNMWFKRILRLNSDFTWDCEWLYRRITGWNCGFKSDCQYKLVLITEF